MEKVFKNLFWGLLVTAGAAFLTNILFPTLFTTMLGIVIWGVAAVAEFVLLFIFLRNIYSTSTYKQTLAVFLVYSSLEGITLAPLFTVFSICNIGFAFLAASLMFGVCYLIGRHAKFKTSSKITSYFMMGLAGLIIATIINLFVASTLLYWLTTYIGILLFIGLTIYDTRKISEKLKYVGDYTDDDYDKAALEGALDLYLDLMNLFILILRFYIDNN